MHVSIRTTILAALLVLGSLCASCDDPDQARGSRTQIINAEPPTVRLDWLRTPPVQIGGGERDLPAYQFLEIVGAAQLADGRIAIANAGSHEIRIFSPGWSEWSTSSTRRPR